MLYRLLESVKAQRPGSSPEAYLRELIIRIAYHPGNRVDELLPWRLSSVSVAAGKSPFL